MSLPLSFATQWSDRLAFDMALMLEGSGENLSDVIQRHNVTAVDIARYKSDKTFLKQIESYQEDIKERGLTFRVKARAQAEELLTTSWLLIHNEDVSPAVKADLIKSTVKWAGLDTRPEGDTTEGGGVKITINLGASPRDERVIDAQVESP